MSWNEPNDNKPENKNPWTGGKKDKQGPPELDEIFRQLRERANKMFGNGFGKGTGSGSTMPPVTPKRTGILILGVILTIYILSGIYIVRPAERAVVLTLGKYTRTVGPGPHWRAPFLQSKTVVDVSEVSTSKHTGQMLTKDENIVLVELAVQYRIGDLQDYLFNVYNPVYSLQEATESAMRSVIGHSTLDQVLTSGRQEVRQQIHEQIENIMARYHAGLQVVDVSMQPARAPEEVKEAFDDAIKAQEDEQRSINQATAYEKRIIPEAQGMANRMLQEAQAYRDQVILKAKGETQRFLELLPEYQQSKQVTRERMYLQAMEQVLKNSSKIVVDSKQGNNMFYLPLDKMMNQTSVVEAASVTPVDSMPQAPSSGNANTGNSVNPAERGRTATVTMPRDNGR